MINSEELWQLKKKMIAQSQRMLQIMYINKKQKCHKYVSKTLRGNPWHLLSQGMEGWHLKSSLHFANRKDLLLHNLFYVKANESLDASQLI